MLLPTAGFVYSSAVSENVGFFPFEVDLGWRPRDPMDFLAGSQPLVQSVKSFWSTVQGAFDDARYAHKLAKARQTAEADAHSKHRSYKLNDEVWVSLKLWTDAYSKTRPSTKLAAR